MNSSINRRRFLRGAGVLIALPALESVGFKPFASASEKKIVKPPKRLAFMSIGYGVTQETWYPDIKDTGAGWKLTEVLPGSAQTWSVDAGEEASVKIRIPNPMEGGRPLRFANREQGEEWLVIEP